MQRVAAPSADILTIKVGALADPGHRQSRDGTGLEGLRQIASHQTSPQSHPDRSVWVIAGRLFRVPLPCGRHNIPLGVMRMFLLTTLGPIWADINLPPAEVLIAEI